MFSLNFSGRAKWSTTHGNFDGADDRAWETSLVLVEKTEDGESWPVNPPPRNKGSIRPYQGKPMVNRPLIKPYFLGGGTLGGV